MYINMEKLGEQGNELEPSGWSTHSCTLKPQQAEEEASVLLFIFKVRNIDLCLFYFIFYFYKFTALEMVVKFSPCCPCIYFILFF